MVAAPLPHHMLGAARHGRCISTAGPLLWTRCRSSPRGRCCSRPGVTPRTLRFHTENGTSVCLPLSACRCPPFSLPPLTGDEPKSLSQDVQETLNFFEQTIDSLEKGLNEEELRPQVKWFNNPVDKDGGSHSHVNVKEQDIIDLVRPKPDLLQTRDTSFTPYSPDFQSLIQHPESHFDVKPRSDPGDPSPLTEFSSSLTDSHSVYHPPGSIPTPALIAQKIAENQSGGSTALSASSLLRRRSSEFDKSTNSNKQGPPTSTKPARYPANIIVVHGNREQQNTSLANINVEERKKLMFLQNHKATSPNSSTKTSTPLPSWAHNTPEVPSEGFVS
uniref:Uncharacterized protein n=1 Tax=Knipowitschia caucasica TaxID=637954 RepID=A0AAV2ISZ9_KNICA